MLMLLLFLVGEACKAADYSDFRCSSNPYAGRVSYSNIIGTNFLSEKVANAVIRKELLKESKGKYKVNLQSYNLSALKKGIFKSLEITGTDTNTDEVYASSVKFKSICDYNYIEINNKEKTTTFREPFGMTFVIKLTEDDLNKTMQGKQYAEIIRKANNIGNTYKLFNISASSVKIKDNKLYYKLSVMVPLLKAKQDLVIETAVKVRGGDIMLAETNLVTESYRFDISKLDKVLNYLNPLNFSMKIFEKEEADMYIQEVTIKDGSVNIAGFATVDKGIMIEE